MANGELIPQQVLLIGFIALAMMLLVARKRIYNRITRTMMDVLMAAALAAFASSILMLVLG